MPNGVIGNTTDSGSVKSRFEPWLGNKWKVEILKYLNFFYFFVAPIKIIIKFAVDYFSLVVGGSR